MRRFLSAAKHLPLLALLCAGPAHAEPSPLAARPATELAGAELEVGDQSGLVQALLAAAGEDRDLPYRLDWHPFTAGPALMEALNAAAVDVGVVGNAPPVFAQAGGFDVRIIAAAEGAEQQRAAGTGGFVPAQRRRAQGQARRRGQGLQRALPAAGRAGRRGAEDR